MKTEISSKLAENSKKIDEAVAHAGWLFERALNAEMVSNVYAMQINLDELSDGINKYDMVCTIDRLYTVRNQMIVNEARWMAALATQEVAATL